MAVASADQGLPSAAPDAERSPKRRRIDLAADGATEVEDPPVDWVPGCNELEDVSGALNFDQVDWDRRACSHVGCDQLLEWNDELSELFQAVTSNHKEPSIVFDSPFGSESLRFLVEAQVRAYFDDQKGFQPQGVELRRIGQADPRTALHGQWGLFCQMNGPALPAGCVVGPYAGRILTNKQYDARYSALPIRLEHERYALGLSFRPGPDPLIIDAMEEGNAVILINDYRLEPFASNHAFKPPNCAYVQLRYKGWPHVFVITLSEVPAGAELLVDYGEEYWEAHHRLHTQLNGLLTALEPFVMALLGGGGDSDSEGDLEDGDLEGDFEGERTAGVG